jgi:hypothetical protein
LRFLLSSILPYFERHKTLLQKPEALTRFGQSDRINNIYLGILDLTPAIDGQYFLAKDGQTVRLLQQ